MSSSQSPGLARRLFRKVARPAAAWAARAGVPVGQKTPNREVLEKRILPTIAAQPDIRRVLFIGTDWYTVAYERVFRAQEYWTLEPDPTRRVYGSKHHEVCFADGASERFAPGYFDAIICNGVFGFGLNDPVSWAKTLEAFSLVLRPGGWLIFGWDDHPPLRPFQPLEVPAAALFEPFTLPQFEGPRHRVGRGSPHLFDFLRKPLTPGGGRAASSV